MNIKDISDLFPKTLILYELASVGHFCCVFENEEGVNFFDPLGIFPDDELFDMSPNRHILGYNFRYLDELLARQPQKVIYNNYQLQQHHTSTCGHWCTIRMIYGDLSNDEFVNCFKDLNGYDRDRLVVRMFNDIMDE